MPEQPGHEDIHGLAARGGVAMFIAAALLDEEVRGMLRARWGTGTTIRALADETGVRHFRVRRILEGDAARDDETAALYEWAHTQPGVYVGPETLAVAILARWGFGAKAGPLRVALVRAVADVYRGTGLSLPPFVYQSLEAAEPAKKR
jgi:hypothetical protein